MNCGLEKLWLIIKNVWSMILSGLFLRTLALSKLQESESIEVAIGME